MKIDDETLNKEFGLLKEYLAEFIDNEVRKWNRKKENEMFQYYLEPNGIHFVHPLPNIPELPRFRVWRNTHLMKKAAKEYLKKEREDFSIYDKNLLEEFKNYKPFRPNK